jgi:metal-responsive CopG/Arc/MetJ family transcriptional regulator
MGGNLLTIRIPKDLNQRLNTMSKKLRLSRSDVVRMALQKFTDEFQVKDEMHPYEKVKGLIGSVESGISDLGSEHRKHLLQRIRRA